MMKLKYLICNHKNKLTYDEVKECVENYKKLDISKINFIVSPSFPYIYNFIEYNLASQDVSAFEETLTGEISARQLNSLKISNVIIGHAERRCLLKESKELLINKIEMANKYNLRVIYCVTENEMFLDDAKQIIAEDLNLIKEYLKENAIIAYEPKWAIGCDVELDIEYIGEIINVIKNTVDNLIIYGGHVNEANVDKILKNEEISGVMVSDASLNYQILQKIINNMT